MFEVLKEKMVHPVLAIQRYIQDIALEEDEGVQRLSLGCAGHLAHSTSRTWSINLSLGFGWNFGLFSMFAILIS
jgi:hypothetical protein